jgi:hypothetical protein
VSSDFIDALPVGTADKEKIRTLGVESEDALYGLIEAAWDQFSSFLGGEAAARLRTFLSSRMPETAPSTPLPRFALGAQISKLPKLGTPTIDIELRDRLFDEWRDLQSDPSTRDSERSAQLRSQLEALLK